MQKTEFDWINELTDLICSMSGCTANWAKTIIYWCIATYGYDKVRKFPVLVFFGKENSGKSTALNIVMKLSKMPPDSKDRIEMVLNPDLSPAVRRDKISAGGTHVAEEADSIDEMLINKVFDKFTGLSTVNRAYGQSQFGKENITVSTALAMHRRQPFKDPATTSRCIMLHTKKLRGGLTASGKAEPDTSLIAEYLPKVEGFAESFSDMWSEIPEFAGRAQELWNPLIFIADRAGDVTFIEYADREIEDAINFDAEQDLDEPDPAVFRTVLELTVNQSGNFSDRIATKEVKANLKQDEIELTSQNINAIAKRIGFEVKNHAGRMYIKLHTNPQKRKAQMQRIADRVDYHDEVLKD